MLANNDSDWNIEDLTDTEIYAAIRYLEPKLRKWGERRYSHNQTETP
jgi:hypothetical protein